MAADPGDFTKIAHDGSALPAAAAPGDGPKGWACTRDNRSGLIWEVKTGAGTWREGQHTYTPFDSNPATNGGWLGYRDATSGRCDRDRMAGRSCNTEAYTAAVNAAALCGRADWRLPTVAELVGIAGERSAAAVQATAAHFPNSAEGWYWTGVSQYGGATYARVILLPPGARARFYDGSYLVRLVADR
ncbi:MAG: DUF1566 domain-containing protein [Rhodanobacteraceae bacterium]|nr:DUF1566 domain-containing protein [Rhodanobacteraceae bacterium]